MDKKDFELLDKLRENCRKPVKEMAKELGMPRTTVVERIKRLEKSGVIRSYEAIPDYEKLGKSILAFILVKYSPESGIKQEITAQEVAKLKNVYAVHVISGEWDMIVKARTASIKELGQLVVTEMKKVPGIAESHSLISYITEKDLI